LEIRSELLFPPIKISVRKNKNWRKNPNFCPRKKKCFGGGVRIWIQHFSTRVAWHERLFFFFCGGEGTDYLCVTYPRYVSTCFHIFYVLLRNFPLLWINCRIMNYLEYWKSVKLYLNFVWVTLSIFV
jgi:hypothetical protein